MNVVAATVLALSMETSACALYMPDGSLHFAEYFTNAVPLEFVIAESLLMRPTGVVTVTVTATPETACDPFLAATVISAERLLPSLLTLAEIVAVR